MSENGKQPYMKEARELATNICRLSGMKGKKHYEGKDHSPVLRPGDRVRKKCTWKRKNWKIAILLGRGNLSSNQAERRREPIYEVEPESGEGLCHVIHSSLILPCNDLTFEKRQRIQPGDRSRKGRLPDQLFCPSPTQPQKPVQMKRLRVCWP